MKKSPKKKSKSTCKNKYKITVSHEQLRLIEHVLELYSRLAIGQFGTLIRYFHEMFPKAMRKIMAQNIRMEDKYTDPMAFELLGFSSGASYGIGSQEVVDSAKVSYDMQKVIQKIIATVENHHSSSVWHHGPMKLGSEPIIEVEKV